MTPRSTRDRVMERFQQHMRDALEGRIELQEVCGLSIEALRMDLMAERNRLLEECGSGEVTDHLESPPPKTRKIKSDQ